MNEKSCTSSFIDAFAGKKDYFDFNCIFNPAYEADYVDVYLKRQIIKELTTVPTEFGPNSYVTWCPFK